MPIYEYECPGCGHVVEELRSIECRGNRAEGGDVMECPECHWPGMERKISVSNIKLRGSGFHDTDYGPHGPKVQ
jgi:putative FmdB family regulatory protein